MLDQRAKLAAIALLPPSNILDGGVGRRGLVAIAPTPCVGDLMLDAADLLLWQAQDLGTILTRVEQLSASTGIDAERLLGWCIAFAGMSALEAASLQDGPRRRIEAFADLPRRPSVLRRQHGRP